MSQARNTKLMVTGAMHVASAEEHEKYLRETQHGPDVIPGSVRRTFYATQGFGLGDPSRGSEWDFKMLVAPYDFTDRNRSDLRQRAQLLELYSSLDPEVVRLRVLTRPQADELVYQASRSAVNYLFPSLNRSQAPMGRAWEYAEEVEQDFGVTRAIFTVHGDKAHPHCHADLANSTPDGRALEWRRDQFIAFTRNMKELSNGAVESAYGRGRKVERELLHMTNQQIHELMLEQRLLVIAWNREQQAKRLKLKKKKEDEEGLCARLWNMALIDSARTQEIRNVIECACIQMDLHPKWARGQESQLLVPAKVAEPELADEKVAMLMRDAVDPEPVIGFSQAV